MRSSASAPPCGGTPDRGRAQRTRQTPAADAIVVLGCRLRTGGLPTRALQRRVALGVELYNAGVAPLVVLAGGIPRAAARTPEAQAMRDLAVAAGMPEEALLLETCSRNTAENALYSARVLHRRGVRRIVLVSHSVHLFRAGLLFRLAGFSVLGWVGAPARSGIAALASGIREAAALPRSVLLVLWRRRR